MISRDDIRIGAQIQLHHLQYDAMRAAWMYMEQLGVDTLFTWDHLTPRFGNPDGNSFECWTTLGAMAEVTERVKIGPLISVDGYRLPAIHTYMARTVNMISGGRLIFGLGAGGWKKDLEAAGLPDSSNSERLRVLEQHLPLLRDRIRSIHPHAIHDAIPILIGGGGEKITLRMVARYADIWNGQGDPSILEHKNRVLDEWCAEVGRDPGEIERSALLVRPEEVEQAEEYVVAGITHLIYSVRAPANDFTPVKALLRWRDTLQQ